MIHRILHIALLLLWCLFSTEAPAQLFGSKEEDKAIVKKEEEIDRAGKADKPKKEARLYRELGDMYFKRKRFGDAYKSYSKESKIWGKLDNLKNEAIALLYVASALQKEERYGKSIRELEDALEIGLKLKDNNIIGSCYGLMANAYRKDGDEIKAREYYTNYKNFEVYVENRFLKKEIEHSEKQRKKVENVLDTTEQVLAKTEQDLQETELLARQRKMKINLLEKEKRIQRLLIAKQETELQNERLIRNMFIFGTLLILVIAIILFISYRNKRRDNKIINEQKEKIVDSINYANKIQSALLPDINRMETFFKDFFVLYIPQGIVSGDFYFFAEQKDALIFAVVDCTGHGVPGAIMSVIGHNALNEIIQSGETEVDQILNQLHARVVKTLQQDSKSNKDGMDISICKYDRKANLLEFSGARNSLFYFKNGEMARLEADLRPVGGVYRRKLKNFTKKTLKIDADTTIFLMSDGYADQFGGPNKRKFHFSHLHSVLNEIKDESGESQCFKLQRHFVEWKGSIEQTDDVCIMGVKLSPNS